MVGKRTIREIIRIMPGVLGSALLLGCSLLFSATAAADALLDKARTLHASGQPDAAFLLLKQHEDARAGEPAFDYLLGIAALDSGNPVQAVFALERVLDIEPDNGPAGAELARAYAAVGELEDARRQLAKVKRQALPADVRQNIDRVMSAVEARIDATTTRFRPFVFMGLGYDSNVNNATEDNQVAAPALGGLVFTLDENSQETDSAIWDLAAGFSFSSPLRPDLYLYGGARYDFRLAVEESDFTTKVANGSLGMRMLHEKDAYSLTVQGERFFVDGASALAGDRDLIGLTGQWQHTLDQRNQLTAFLQAAIIEFPEQEIRDVNRYSGGVGWGHSFGTATDSPVAYGSVYGGTEDPDDDTLGEHIGRDFVGVRVGAQYLFRPRMIAFGSFTYQYSDYDAADPTFLEVRQDDYFDVGVGVRYQHDRNWSLTPTVRYSSSDSTLVINDYDRVEVMLTARRDF